GFCRRSPPRSPRDDGLPFLTSLFSFAVRLGDCREIQFAGGFQRHVVGEFAVVLTGELKARDLKRTLNSSESRDHDLIANDRSIEERSAHERVARSVLKQTAARYGSALHASPIEQLAPTGGALGGRNGAGPGIEREPACSQPGNRGVTCAIRYFDQKVFAFLSSH